MKIEIRKLTHDLVQDYIYFFDVTPHDDHKEEHKCYCVMWSSDNCEGKDFSSAQKRRSYASNYVMNNYLQGYLAYLDGKVVGWCNANTKADCLHSMGWTNFMNFVPLDNIDLKVESIFCFVVAPEMQRKGIATKLLERVCEDAKKEGYDLLEAYPYKENAFTASSFAGYLEMYLKCGFEIIKETDIGFVMRKYIK